MMDSASSQTEDKRDGIHVRRVLWRKAQIVVYQDSSGLYWWADLDIKKKRPVIVKAGKHPAESAEGGSDERIGK